MVSAAHFNFPSKFQYENPISVIFRSQAVILAMLRAQGKLVGAQRWASSYNQAKSLRRYPVGSSLHGYEINRVLPVPELSFTAVDLTHKRTGSKHLHIERDDTNNVFSIAFKTNPPNKTGIPHILEHTTLCGSYKYPVRDPFFKMLNRSLSNFMNAMTGHDYTFFPFCTTNAKDFENLRDVYLDSVLNPLLKKQDFYQEGWRLENEDVHDINSPLTFKGVVYNEMKGQVSNASYLFWIKFQESIYPSLNNSGGDPTKITDLIYEDLLDFHAKHYHPSNSKTFTYGNLSLKETLAKLDESFKVFGQRKIKNLVKEPIELTETMEVKVPGPIDPMTPADKQLKASITWPCGDPADIYETFCLKILSSLLTDGHSSPLYQKLIESGLGDDFTVNSGMDSTTSKNFFTIGLQGLKDVKVLETELNSVLKYYSENKFDDKKIEAIIQQIELSKKDQKSNFGLGLLYSILPGWVNKVDPFETLQWDAIIARFNEEYSNTPLFQNLIKKYFIDKPVFKFQMIPTENYEESVKTEEKTRLEKKVKNLDEEDKKIIYNRGLELTELQNQVEDLSSLPTLQVRDISRYGLLHPVTFSGDNDSIQKRITDTNGLTYFNSIKDIAIPYELLPYLSLFSSCLTNLGTTTESMAEIEDEIKLYTGGLSSSVSVHSSPIDLNPRISFNLNGVSLNKNSSKIYSIWEKLLLDTNFQNKEKLATLIRTMSSNNISGLAEGGHGYVRNYAANSISKTKAISDQISGISQLKFLNQLNTWIQDDESFNKNIIEKLEQLKTYIVNSDKFKFSIISDKESVLTNESLISSFINKLPAAESALLNNQSYLPTNFPLNSNTESYIKLPFQVGYASSVYKGVPYTHEDGAKLQVLAQLLTFKYLHKEIREKGGAYGGGATYGGLDGLFSYYSYRDPNSVKSLETFGKAGEFGASNEWKDQDLDEAKLTIFQSIDAPTSAKSEGKILFREQITDEMRQERREQLLDVDLEDVKQVAEEYLVGQPASHAIMGNSPDEAPQKEQKWDIVDLSV